MGRGLGTPHRLAWAKSQFLEQRKFDPPGDAVSTGTPTAIVGEEFSAALDALRHGSANYLLASLSSTFLRELPASLTA